MLARTPVTPRPRSILRGDVRAWNLRRDLVREESEPADTVRHQRAGDIVDRAAKRRYGELRYCVTCNGTVPVPFHDSTSHSLCFAVKRETTVQIAASGSFNEPRWRFTRVSHLAVLAEKRRWPFGSFLRRQPREISWTA